MRISIIIPTYNEASTLRRLVEFLLRETQEQDIEIIIADGQSPDGTLTTIADLPIRGLTSPRKGRGAQMNYGASVATGDWLYFLHADSIPPRRFVEQIRQALTAGYGAGCFRLRFDHRHWFLRANAWFTRFDWDWVRFGDQSLFVSRTIFEKAGRFREDWIIMEDQEIIGRLKKHGKFTVCADYVTTSARKYLDNGIIRLQLVFFIIWLQWKLGYSEQQLVQTYRKLIQKQDKI